MFVGTVKKVNAATMSIVPATDRTVVVRVDEVLYAPKTMADLTGREVTVQLIEANSVKIDQRLAFFTNGGLFGSGIALAEVGHLEAGKDTKVLRQQIEESLQKKDDEDLQKRIRDAELIVVGRVTYTRPAKLTQYQPRTEHDPEWHEAEIQVESVEKGQLAARTVMVLFANSLDSMWYRSPKFKKGQEGIWILHMNAVKWPGVENRYMAIDPLDFQSKDQLGRIRQLIKATG
jgi:hypothetical protein